MLSTPLFRSRVFAAFAASAAVLALTPLSARAQAPAKPAIVPPGVTNACLGYPQLTTVAYLNEGKYGSAIKVFGEPNENAQPIKTLATGIEFKGRPTFTVIGTDGDWVHVNVAARPNGLTGYVRKADVKTYQHPWVIVIELGRKQLTVCNSGRAVQREKIGIGKASTPTPTGNCYTVDLIKTKKPSGAYGPYAYGLSCFSDVVFSFGAGGDGRLGVHGTNSPGSLGTPVSSGCIRVSNAGITKMAKTLPVGVPTFIIN
jgi:lipoprotein-anchoring transpeptidase ErfK/SrfK